MNSYTRLEKLLNYQFLGDTELSNLFFNRNFRKIKKNNIKKIFITGLARSGTTALLNQLFTNDSIASIQYKHMPFVLSPRLSNLISKYFISSKGEYKRERLHGDNIFISHNSPECLDEPFWIKDNKNYFSKPLNPNYKISKETLEAYGNFLNKHALFQSKKNIVIKNNNNHIRLLTLSDYFKESIFIVLFRNPINQAASLLKTHKRLCDLQKKDSYILDYMNIIGHREFGLNQTYFEYDNYSFSKLKSSSVEGNNCINYWIQAWINAYSWLTEVCAKKRENIYFVAYEDLCSKENIILKKIFNSIEIDIDTENLLINKNSDLKKYEDNHLLQEANQIYANLRERSIK